MTICFIAEDASAAVNIGLGASLAVGEARLLGTLLGGIFAAVAAPFILGTPGIVGASAPKWQPLGFAGLLAPWAALSGLFRGHVSKSYAAIVAAFTAAIIMHGAAKQASLSRALAQTGCADDNGDDYGDDDGDGDDDDGSSSGGVWGGEGLALHRIKMNTVGVILLILVEVSLFPRPASADVRGDARGDDARGDEPRTVAAALADVTRSALTRLLDDEGREGGEDGNEKDEEKVKEGGDKKGHASEQNKDSGYDEGDDDDDDDDDDDRAEDNEDKEDGKEDEDYCGAVLAKAAAHIALMRGLLNSVSELVKKQEKTLKSEFMN